MANRLFKIRYADGLTAYTVCGDIYEAVRINNGHNDVVAVCEVADSLDDELHDPVWINAVKRVSVYLPDAADHGDKVEQILRGLYMSFIEAADDSDIKAEQAFRDVLKEKDD
jgi:hypothetical protein